MYYSHFFITGLLDEKSEVGQLSNGTPVITLWISVEKPFFTGENLCIERSRVPIKIIGKHAQNWGKILTEGMTVSAEGEIRSYDWQGLNEFAEEMIYKIIELVAIRVRMCEDVSIKAIER